VAQDIVSVFAGGPGDRGLVAYDAASGAPAWSVATGPHSYSSPQLVQSGGEELVLFLSDAGLLALDPRSGTTRWKFGEASNAPWRVVQPRQVDDHSFLIGSEDLGLVRFELAAGESPPKAVQRWATRGMRPAYNDFVVCDGCVFGFDEAILCCVDLETGKRLWKGGRYGHGQLLLVADPKLLVVVSESGEAILIAAHRKRHEELGRFQAVHGKTWNHPVIVHGRLFVRNDEEIACYNVEPQR
jgi:hypothetical protein